MLDATLSISYTPFMTHDPAESSKLRGRWNLWDAVSMLTANSAAIPDLANATNAQHSGSFPLSFAQLPAIRKEDAILRLLWNTPNGTGFFHCGSPLLFLSPSQIRTMDFHVWHPLKRWLNQLGCLKTIDLPTCLPLVVKNDELWIPIIGSLEKRVPLNPHVNEFISYIMWSLNKFNRKATEIKGTNHFERHLHLSLFVDLQFELQRHRQ